MPWLRLFTDVLDDVDLNALPDDVQLAWYKFLICAKRFDRNGELPKLKVLAHWLRKDQQHDVVARWIGELLEAGLLDRRGNAVAIHGWERWQAPTDRTNAKRQAAWRERHRGTTGEQDGSPPPDPPEREEKRRERGEVTALVTPLRTPRNAPSGPEEVALLSDAMERWGDKNGESVVSDLLREYPAAWVKVACDKHWDKHQHAFSPAYLRGTLQGFQRDGGPSKASVNGKYKPSKPAPATNGADYYHVARPIRDDGPKISAAEALRIMKGQAS